MLNVIMETAIRVEGLTKRFGAFTAVDDVSFKVKPGEIFGILGPNGAGKTTTLEIIEGLQKPTGGRVSVLGLDVQREARRIKSRIGVQLQSSAYFDYLTLREILALLGSFYPRRFPPDQLLERVGLLDKGAQRVRQLSGGQQQRFSLAASLVNDPEVVVLDEPTTGLDPQARRNIWALIRDIHGCYCSADHPLHGGSPEPVPAAGHYGPRQAAGGGNAPGPHQRSESRLHRKDGGAPAPD